MKQIITILMLTCACFKTQAQVNIITTICGNDTAGYSGDGGAAKDAKIDHPEHVCVDNFGDLYFTDTYNHRIRKIVLNTGIISTIAGTGVGGYNGDGILATNAQLFLPDAICIDSIGNLYIADPFNYRVRRVDKSTGIISTIAGKGIVGNSGNGGPATNARIDAPTGLCLDKTNNLFIADINNNNIRKVSLVTGIISNIAGTGASGYSGDNGPATIATLSGPAKVYCDIFGNIVFTDLLNSVIRKVNTSTGIITTIAGDGSIGYSGDGNQATNAQLNNPYGIFIDKYNDIYFAEWGNGVIRKIDALTGIITTVVGMGIQGFMGDEGPATSAQLIPDGVCIDSNGTMYIADYGNDRIRKVYNPYLAVSENKVANEYELYPNPARNELTIEGARNTTIVLCDVMGKVVMERKLNNEKETIDISSLNNGVYVVQVYDAVSGTKTAKKLVKQ